MSSVGDRKILTVNVLFISGSYIELEYRSADPPAVTWQTLLIRQDVHMEMIQFMDAFPF